MTKKTEYKTEWLSGAVRKLISIVDGTEEVNKLQIIFIFHRNNSLSNLRQVPISSLDIKRHRQAINTITRSRYFKH